MTEETKRTLSSTSCDQTENASGADRRSFLIKAGIAAPLAILATSRPAWGDLTNQDFRCGISGLVSGNVSIAPGQDLCNGGFSPGYWGNKNGFPAGPASMTRPSAAPAAFSYTARAAAIKSPAMQV